MIFGINIYTLIVALIQSLLCLRPHVQKPARLFCPWYFPGKNTGVGCHFLLGDLPDPGIEPASPAWQADSLPVSRLGGPMYTHLYI